MKEISKKIASLKVIIMIVVGLFLLTTIEFIGDDFINMKSKTSFIASDKPEIELYNLSFEKESFIYRGTKVNIKEENIKNENKDKNYSKIEYENKIYLIESKFLVSTYEETVLEKKVYIRTPITIYKDVDSSKILSMANKGTEVEILGFDKINPNGVVNRYNIKIDNVVGYAYGKYMVLTKEEALKIYDEEGNYQIHKTRTNTLGGGSAANIDYYPYEKADFADNIMPNEVKALYLNTGVLGKIDQYIELAKKTDINAFVVDIKDNTRPGYPSEVMKEYSPTNYDKAYNSFDKYRNTIKKLKDEGFYVIGRITIFKDSYYINDHPEDAIIDTKTKEPFNHNNSFWPSAYRHNVWEFNVELAKEAVKEMGFNEIQFDYVRFPDRTYSLERDNLIDMNNTYNEEKAQAIQRFLMYACDEIHEVGAYVSADVFGESVHNYVTGYGQYWGAISNIVDVISPMPYPDHFNSHEYDFEEVVWTVPYELLKFWGETYVIKRQNEIPTPAIVRTWIQTYNVSKTPQVEYDAKKVNEQINALTDSGLTGGYMTWNSGSSLEKYNSLIPAFKEGD